MFAHEKVIHTLYLKGNLYFTPEKFLIST